MSQLELLSGGEILCGGFYPRVSCCLQSDSPGLGRLENKVFFKQLLMNFAFTMQEKMLGYAFQTSRESKSEDQHLTTWTRWKTMRKSKRSAESTNTTASVSRRS